MKLKKETIKKIKEYAKTFEKEIIKVAIKKGESGAIDVDSYLQDWTLAKLLVTSAVDNIKEMFLPLRNEESYKSFYDDFYNLKKF